MAALRLFFLLIACAAGASLLKRSSSVPSSGGHGGISMSKLAREGYTPELFLAVTQGFLDYTEDMLLPIGLDYLRTNPLPNPLVAEKGWKILDAVINDVDANLEFSLASPATFGINLSDLKLSLSAKVKKGAISSKVDVTVQGGVSVAFGLEVKDFLPRLKLVSCETTLDPHVELHGLAMLLNPIINSMKSVINKRICGAGVTDTLRSLNPVLQQLTAGYTLNLPEPVDNSVMVDYHLIAAQVVKSDTTYLSLATTGEVFRKDGLRDPERRPWLPSLNRKQLGSKMMSAQVGAFAFNSLAWTLWSQDMLTVGPLGPETIPADPKSIGLGKNLMYTGAYAVFMPKLYWDYPGAELNVVVNATSAPVITIEPSGVGISMELSMNFYVPAAAKDGKDPFAFSLKSEFKGSATMAIEGNKVFTQIDDFTMKLHPLESAYGKLGTNVLTFLSPPVINIWKHSLIPDMNKIMGQGIELVPVHAEVGGVGTVDSKLVNPSITLFKGYALIASDLDIKFRPVAPQGRLSMK